jgi:hypothetical protein
MKILMSLMVSGVAVCGIYWIFKVDFSSPPQSSELNPLRFHINKWLGRLIVAVSLLFATVSFLCGIWGP